ncbi:hypothetical protein [Staphylococcus americanisciuri]|uniref:Type II secretion system protein n=1 Tax=Staphylococcus americanisciuri TaxID=2973940 RepID=A0ABT2EZC3_9STAP|nr:hypothetical protein [Staphylococcus americanisciuri]MCS4485522.1 hypothetical protein [Staphylococcus americanisciuri]
MNRSAYTLLEALFAFFLVSLLSFSTLPLLHQLALTYQDNIDELDLKRTLYFYLKENTLEGRMQFDRYVINHTHQNICITNIQNNKTYCHQSARVYHD